LFISFIITLTIFSGCGYKPTSYYAKNEINGKVYVKLNVNINNTDNSILIKDAVNEMVVQQFRSSLIEDKNKANTLIDVSLLSVSFTTLQLDNQGYAKLYRTTVAIGLNYHNIDTNKTKSLIVNGSYDYSVDVDSVITDTKKDESIKIAAQKALADIFSIIAVQSFRYGKKRQKQSINTKNKDNYDNNTGKSRAYFFFK
jgi:hypothetical protein